MGPDHDALLAQDLFQLGAKRLPPVHVQRVGHHLDNHDVIQRVKEKITQITPSLPPGITIKPFYDRSDLIATAQGAFVINRPAA